LLAGVSDRTLLEPPINVLRLSVHPGGIAPMIANLAEWRAHLLDRLHRQIEVTADPVLSRLRSELLAYASDSESGPHGSVDSYAGLVVPLQLRTPQGVLSFLSTTTVFGTPIDVTLSELAVEAFLPADAATSDALRALATSRDGEA
jgi:hypothetical protein